MVAIFSVNCKLDACTLLSIHLQTRIIIYSEDPQNFEASVLSMSLITDLFFVFLSFLAFLFAAADNLAFFLLVHGQSSKVFLVPLKPGKNRKLQLVILLLKALSVVLYFGDLLRKDNETVPSS